jgi:hypothetical protein
MNRYVIETADNTVRIWQADDAEHAREQHIDAFHDHPDELPVKVYEQVAEPMQGEGWFVVVERCEHEELDYAELPPYIIGPYKTEAEAEEECLSDSSITYCLLTIDAKTENYIAGGDCYWTDTPPEGIQIIPPA